MYRVTLFWQVEKRNNRSYFCKVFNEIFSVNTMKHFFCERVLKKGLNVRRKKYENQTKLFYLY